MRASEMMTVGVHTVSTAAAAEDAWDVMRQKGIHHLVVKDGSALVGVLSDRDVGSRRGAALRKGRSVGELMSPHVVTVDPSTPVRKVANLMRGRSIGCVVVTDRSRVVGIITVSDLLELLGRGVDRPQVRGNRVDVNHRAPHEKRHRSTGVW